MNTLKGEEEDIIDLTDDPPDEPTSVAPDIEFVGETRASPRPTPARRRRANNSVLIVEDDPPAVLDDEHPIPQVACHFFYPCEEDGGGEEIAGGGDDPLAPIPEWVDCSTLPPEQVSVNDELPVFVSVPEKNATSFGYLDPLRITRPIKTEPDAEIDVKPSVEQLSMSVPAETSNECSRGKKFEEATPTIKKEWAVNPSDISSGGKSNKRKINDIDLNCTIPPKKLKTGKRVGPKCAKFRQNEKKSSTKTPDIKWTNHQSSDINRSSAPKRTNITRKVGPKCAKFRLKEEKPITELDSKDLIPPKKTCLQNKVGPKCAKFRLKEEKPITELDSKDLIPPKKTTLQNKEVEKNIVIKPAVVSIGPKLPLPQCFKRKQSLPKETVQCTKYEFTQKNYNKLDRHLDNDHIVLKIYTCFKCNHKCTDPLFHEEHVNICSAKRHSKPTNLSSLQDYHQQNGFYKCEICPFKFKNQENLTNHFNHHGVKGFICHICQLTFLTLVQLHNHTNDNHKNLEKVFSCNTCEYSSQSVHHLKDHMIKHNADRNLFCYICKHNFEDIEDIEKHRAKFHKRTKIKTLENKTKQIDRAVEANINVSKDKKPTVMLAEDEEQSKANNVINTIINGELTPKDRLTAMVEDTKCPVSIMKSFEAQIIEKKGKYYCNGCCYSFSHLKNLIKHKKHHLRNKPFTCCNSSFVSLSFIDFSKHVKENHDKFKFTCSMCPLTFMRDISLRTHLVKHVNDGLYCYQCKKNLENADAFRSHISTMHANMSIAKYKCIECSFRTPFQSILNRHLIKHKRSQMQSETLTNVKCSEAELNHVVNESGRKETVKVTKRMKSERNVTTFDSSQDKLKRDLSTSVLTCTVCSLKLSGAEELKEHIIHVHEQGHVISDKVLENKGFKCNKCAFSCSKPTIFIEHMKNGHKKRKFICNICRSDFTFFRFYLKHMKNHAACAVVYSCNECRFNSRKEKVFAKHMRTHILKCCPLCDYKTLRYDSFKTHLEMIHTVESEYPSSWNTSPQSLENASSTLETEENVSETELTSKNDIEKPHVCCFCTYKTANIHNLRRHMAVHFSNSTDSSNEKLSRKVSKPRLKVKRLKGKTLATKLARKGILKMSGKVRNGLTTLYCCTQCEYKKKDRRTVAAHLFRKHNIRGAVRNFTIKKIYVNVPSTEDTDAKTDCGNSNVKRKTKNVGKDKRLCSVGDENESVPNKSMLVKQTDEKNWEERSKRIKKSKSTNSVIWKCSSCDLQKLSLLAQLQHKKYGHMGFWQRPFSCTICGFRSADKGNLIKHLKWKHEAIEKKHQLLNNKEKYTRTEGISRRADIFNNAGVAKKSDHIVKNYKKKKAAAIVKCPACNIESFSETAQFQHSKLGHDAFWDRYYSCDICEMRFSNKGRFGVHKLAHEKKLSCNKCHKLVSFKLKEAHKQTCRGSGEVAVESGQIPPNRLSPTQDIRNGRDLNPDDDENYVCGECDFVTTNVIEFSTHMFIHSGIPDD